MNILKSLNVNKSPGPDDISGLVLKKCALSLGVIHKRCPQERGVKQKRTTADKGGGGLSKIGRPYLAQI